MRSLALTTAEDMLLLAMGSHQLLSISRGAGVLVKANIPRAAARADTGMKLSDP